MVPHAREAVAAKAWRGFRAGDRGRCRVSPRMGRPGQRGIILGVNVQRHALPLGLPPALQAPPGGGGPGRDPAAGLVEQWRAHGHWGVPVQAGLPPLCPVRADPGRRTPTASLGQSSHRVKDRAMRPPVSGALSAPLHHGCSPAPPPRSGAAGVCVAADVHDSLSRLSASITWRRMPPSRIQARTASALLR